ncbi:MAG: hypothetical protein KF871_03125 [Hydrogenophaga sp.]|nr:hypothetical protein [Hydrogenophaga sp.]
MPSDVVSRRAFLGLAPLEPQTRTISLKTYVAFVVGAWALSQSMDRRSINHKSSAADDFSRGRALASRFANRYAAVKQGDSRQVWYAKELLYAGTGTCDRHAALNFVLIGAGLKHIYDEFPALRAHLPTVEMVSDPTAGERLGGPVHDAHVFVVVKGDGDPVLVDSWVPFPRLGLAGDGVCRASLSLYSFDVIRDPHTLPGDVLAQLDALAEAGSSEPPPQMLSDAHYADPSHWCTSNGQRLRGWQMVDALREDCATVYTCGDLHFDPDHMCAEALAMRKRWVQEATHALTIGEQSPIRGAPAFSPLRRNPVPDGN